MESVSSPRFLSHQRLQYREDCPFNHCASGLCVASLSAMAIDRATHTKYCGIDNHDACPIFLSKVLRSS